MKRADFPIGVWQPVSGGIEEREKQLQTVIREVREEVGIDLKENRFGFEPEITAKIARIPKGRIYEVGISYYGRTYEEGKKIGWRDGFRAIYCIIKYGLFKSK